MPRRETIGSLDIAKQINETYGVPIRDVRDVLRAFFTACEESLVAEKIVRMRNFGQMSTRRRKGYAISRPFGRNTPIVQDDTLVLKFAPCARLRAKLKLPKEVAK